MDFTFCFGQFKKKIPNRLVSEYYLSKISGIAPAVNSFSLASIECRLAEKEDQVDLAIGYTHGLLRNLVKPKLNLDLWRRLGICESDPGQLEKMLDFFGNELRQKHFLQDTIEGVWVNLDLSHGQDLGLPWIYIVFRYLGLGPEFYNHLMIKTVQTLDIRYDQATISLMQEVLKSLPEHAYLLGMAVPSQRNGHSFRLVLYGMNFREVGNYLGKISWAGDLEDFVLKMGSAADRCTKLGLLLDFSNGSIHPKLGVELLLDPLDSGKHSQEVLKSLLDLGLCSKAKSADLVLWLRDQEAFGNSQQSVRQWINHFKMVYEPGKPISAKCYFGIRPG